MTETQQTINNVIAKMIAYSDGNKHDIAHFLKVYTYARMIGEMENLTERKQEILEIAAVILLVAMIAAIALTLRKRKDSKAINPSTQIRVRAADRLAVVKVAATQKPAAQEPAQAAAEEKKA